MSSQIDGLSRWIARIALLAVIVWGLAVPCWGVTITPAPFTPTDPIGGKPIGFAYAGNKFVGTILGDGPNLLYSTDLTGNNVLPFGGSVSLLPGFGQEHYVSSSLGLGGFPNGDIYVASGSNIQHITNAGVPDAGLFVGSSTPINGLVRGITFDAVGTFGNQMIVTTQQGYVYTISSTGNATQIAKFVGEDLEGLDIAPQNGPWGTSGSLYVASESAGAIHSIAPITFNTATPITGLTAPEQLDFIPMNAGTGGSLEGLYTANFDLTNPVSVFKAPGSQFTSIAGDMIVTSETTKAILDISFPGNVASAGAFLFQPEDGLYVTADMIAANAPEPASLGLLGLGSMMMLMRRRRA